MKKTQYVILAAGLAVMINSCSGGETKADPADAENKEFPAAERNSGDKLPEAVAPSAKPDSSATVTSNNEIIARIDKYLVSSPDPGNTSVSIRNTLSNITFQKAIVEVTFLADDGKALKSDYFTIQNIEPGDVEVIRIPATAKATSLVTHVVKIKSNTLTNGEMVLAGTHFDDGK